MNKINITKNSIQALIVDMDGVLWRGTEAIGDLKSIFTQINQIGWKVIFATNNASRTIKQYIELLSSFGVEAEAGQIISSATAAITYLRNKFPKGGPVYVIGEQGLIESCAENGFNQSESNALAVVAGIDRNLTYDKLKVATLLIRSGVPFIGTNPDRTFPTPQGLIPGAGSILAALTAASDVSPIIMGKPEPTMYQIALERLQLLAENVLVVGDRPETDIVGAQIIGCRTALVLSGVTNADQANAWQPAPDIITEDLESLISTDW
ncbi:MAG: HAD-IIA family hydrolase [Anaerolineales bacterium]